VTAPSKVWVCGLCLVGIAGSNSVGGWIFVCSECRVLIGRGLSVKLVIRPRRPTECGVPYESNRRAPRIGLKPHRKKKSNINTFGS
jgi:hypothetical protein